MPKAMPKTSMRPRPTQAPTTRTPTKRSTWGGRRSGAGRKRSFKKNQDVPHTKRPTFKELSVFHVTMRIRPGLPNLRTPEAANAIATTFARAVAEDRLAPVPLVDPDQSPASGPRSRLLDRALPGHAVPHHPHRIGPQQGLEAQRHRLRPALLCQSRGKKPGRSANVIRYVLLNRKRHGSRLHAVDPYSSGRWFKGWATPPPPAPPAPKPVAEVRSCLLQEDYWRFFGPAHRRPGTASRPAGLRHAPRRDARLTSPQPASLPPHRRTATAVRLTASPLPPPCAPHLSRPPATGTIRPTIARHPVSGVPSPLPQSRSQVPRTSAAWLGTTPMERHPLPAAGPSTSGHGPWVRCSSTAAAASAALRPRRTVTAVLRHGRRK